MLITICIYFLLANGDWGCRCYEEKVNPPVHTEKQFPVPAQREARISRLSLDRNTGEVQ